MQINFDQTLATLFDTTQTDWDFQDDASGGDLKLMNFNSNPYKQLQQVAGYEKLDSFVKDKLQKSQVYSLSEVKGWNRVELQNSQLIDMFGSDVIFTPPSKGKDDKDAAFYKVLEDLFGSLAYNGQDGNNQHVSATGDSFELNDTKQYGVTSSLLGVFNKE